MANGKTPHGTGSPLNDDWQVAQARSLLTRLGYAVIPNGGAKLFEMRDQYDRSLAPADQAGQDALAAAALQRMAHRLGVLLLTNKQIEIVMEPGKNGLPDKYALRIFVVAPHAAAGMTVKEVPQT